MRYALVLLALVLCSCATHPIQYTAPDAGKVHASEAKLAASVEESRKAAGSAKAAVTRARSTAETVKQASDSIGANLATLHNHAPAALRPEIAALQGLIIKQQDGNTQLRSDLEDAAARQKELDDALARAEQNRAQLQSDIAHYAQEAQKLADAATNERNKRIKSENSLSWYRWHWWGSWLVLGAGVLACVIVAILKFTGRLALKLP